MNPVYIVKFSDSWNKIFDVYLSDTAYFNNTSTQKIQLIPNGSLVVVTEPST